jgi:hypothetical protein
MTNSFVRPMALSIDQTYAMPPAFPSARKAMNVIVVATALSALPTNAVAGTVEATLDPRRLTSRWTNTGDVLTEAPSDRAFADAVLEIRRRSGLTWEQLGALFGVDRRSVHLWASGRPMSARNAEHLNRILAVLRRADRGTPSATKAWLHSPTPRGLLPLDLLRESRFDEIPTPGGAEVVSRPAPLSDAARRARAPMPPEHLVGARQDRVHVERGKLLAAVPLKVSKPK